MKSTDPRNSNLEIQPNPLSNLKLNKLRSLGIASMVISGAIAITSSMANVAQAQTSKVPVKPLAAGACASATNAAMMPQQGMSNHMMMMTGEAADRHFIEMMVAHHDGAVKMAELALKRSKNADVLKVAASIKRDQDLETTQMRDWYKQWYKADVPDMSSPSMKPSNSMMGMNGGKMEMGNMTDMPSNMSSSSMKPSSSMMGMTGCKMCMGNMMGMSGCKMCMGNMTDMPSNRMGKMSMGNMMPTDLKKLETAKDSDFDKAFLAEMIAHHKMALTMSNMVVDSDRPELRKFAQNILRSQSQEIDQMRGWYSNIR